MKAASVNEIRKELVHKDVKELQELCLRLGRYKKENKELLTYLLFESHDEQGYAEGVKNALATHFDALPSNVYYIKKSLRKILRIANKQIKYSGVHQTELEVRIYICSMILDKHIPIRSSPVLWNMYTQQIKKIEAALAKLDEDLQYDYTTDIERLKKGQSL